MKNLTRRSFVKKSVAGSLIAANLSIFSGLVMATGGNGSETGTGTDTGTDTWTETVPDTDTDTSDGTDFPTTPPASWCTKQSTQPTCNVWTYLNGNKKKGKCKNAGALCICDYTDGVGWICKGR